MLNRVLNVDAFFCFTSQAKLLRKVPTCSPVLKQEPQDWELCCLTNWRIF